MNLSRRQTNAALWIDIMLEEYSCSNLCKGLTSNYLCSRSCKQKHMLETVSSRSHSLPNYLVVFNYWGPIVSYQNLDYDRHIVLRPEKNYSRLRFPHRPLKKGPNQKILLKKFFFFFTFSFQIFFFKQFFHGNKIIKKYYGIKIFFPWPSDAKIKNLTETGDKNISFFFGLRAHSAYHHYPQSSLFRKHTAQIAYTLHVNMPHLNLHYFGSG